MLLACVEVGVSMLSLAHMPRWGSEPIFAGNWQVNEELLKIKADGSKQFAKKEYAKAADMYEKALRTLAGTPEAKEERALLHSHKAACFLMLKRFGSLAGAWLFAYWTGELGRS